MVCKLGETKEVYLKTIIPYSIAFNIQNTHRKLSVFL